LGDTAYTFGVSGDLYDSNLLMYDRQTRSEWLQITGQAIEGVLRGGYLRSVPVAYDTWNHWKLHHPNGLVLSVHNGYERQLGNYEVSPYAGYETSPALFFYVERNNGLLPRKARVVGVEVHGADKAYKEDTVWARGSIRDRLGGEDITVLADRETSRIGAFPSKGHTFSLIGGDVRDEQERIWSWQGDELLHGDEHLQSFTVIQTFWFAWSAIHPRTELLVP
jgi:hypothetical protein